ncbi:ActS/PrrB/RegB family redox-sensitive histidine kinase [Methylovirgula sp. HY1]|uniref:ActS/PrrB/RegB family redox-sensitive histidine kinase n=1 Tax=Methylovirgula sp. HY1 TaxID=2822761 RepID=UPI001C5BF831|nr:ActS/PrrB/RegB family redox-sensitive histidine kinase [Methylovirgula sp. HY1]QXX75915.1 Sensor histidine kinase RegB [Methylovirgula sp. HY1]
MPDAIGLDLGRRSRRLRVDTLIRLRWLALCGQTLAVLLVHFGFGFPIPLGMCLLVIAISAWLNIFLRLRFGRSDRLDEPTAAAMLAYDIIQLSLLLFLTGGLTNPFSILFLAPIMIGAISFSSRITLGLTLLMIVAATTLTFLHYPLPWSPNETLDLPFLYNAGIWIAITVGAIFIAIYASWVAEETRKLADAFAATELVIARERHLTQLDGLAAAAAHELGTPLATITLVVKELQKQLPTGSAFEEDVALLSQEVTRCRSILGKLASLDDESGDFLGEMSVGVLLEEAAGPHRDFGVKINIESEGDGPEPVCRRNPAMLYGLGNLVENAIDFARSEVTIQAHWTARTIEVAIKDDGPGFSPEVMGSLGEPYVTTKKDRRAKSEEDSGLGLGLFIAKTLLERSGATVKPTNQPPPGNGACITIRWPRMAFEQGRRAGRNFDESPKISVKMT